MRSAVYFYDAHRERARLHMHMHSYTTCKRAHTRVTTYMHSNEYVNTSSDAARQQNASSLRRKSILISAKMSLARVCMHVRLNVCVRACERACVRMRARTATTHMEKKSIMTVRMVCRTNSEFENHPRFLQSIRSVCRVVWPAISLSSFTAGAWT
jgi:hypothetical protein